MKIYDLRSDTITKPTEDMRKAMYNAEVGDDVYAEDPTINALQEKAAALVGKEAGIFVPSGSMGNLIPIYLLCGKGNELIAHKQSHILHYEMTSLASIAGSMAVSAEGDRGILRAEVIEELIRGDIYYLPRTTLIEIENSHNLAGGTCYSKADLEGVSRLAASRGITVHMDGARLFNAAEYTGLSAAETCSYTDTVTFCLSKGLGAPVGSMLCGTADFIAEARRVRKLLGGGMRQAGVLAAAGIYALDNNIDRLAEDHENARSLAAVLSRMAWVDLKPESIETNIIYFSTPNHAAADVSAALKDNGVLCHATGPGSIRMVTCLETTRDDISEVCRIIEKLQI
ncbi:MAG: low specificity L-threonine aldolase [Spirochaetales bacterium]|jgi:threonine aldolase|nr:low specificity L-threonine aldolase [Spirochaetales bacterium]